MSSGIVFPPFLIQKYGKHDVYGAMMMLNFQFKCGPNHRWECSNARQALARLSLTGCGSKLVKWHLENQHKRALPEVTNCIKWGWALKIIPVAIGLQQVVSHQLNQVLGHYVDVEVQTVQVPHPRIQPVFWHARELAGSTHVSAQWCGPSAVVVKTGWEWLVADWCGWTRLIWRVIHLDVHFRFDLDFGRVYSLKMEYSERLTSLTLQGQKTVQRLTSL